MPLKRVFNVNPVHICIILTDKCGVGESTVHCLGCVQSAETQQERQKAAVQ